MKNQIFTILMVLISIISLKAQTYTEQSSIFMMPLYSVHASWADYNNDGYLDVAYTGTLGGYAGAATYLYKNNGNTTPWSFSEQVNCGFENVYNEESYFGNWR